MLIFFLKGQDRTLSCMTGPDQGPLCLPPKWLSTPLLPLRPIPHLTQAFQPEWESLELTVLPTNTASRSLSRTHIPSICCLTPLTCEAHCGIVLPACPASVGMDEISCLSVASFASIFSHSEGCLFTLLTVSFVVHKLLRFVSKANHSISW